jgi:hypothetical protein
MTPKIKWGFLIYKIFIVMKIVIKEDKRDRLAKQILTEEFSGMYEDVNYYTDSMGEKMRIEYRNGDGVIMIYGSAAKSLYICEDVTRPLRMLSYTQKQVRDIIGEWFSEFFELPVEIVHHVNKAVLN